MYTARESLLTALTLWPSLEQSLDKKDYKMNVIIMMTKDRIGIITVTTNVAIDLCEVFDGNTNVQITSDLLMSQRIKILSITFISNLN